MESLIVIVAVVVAVAIGILATIKSGGKLGVGVYQSKANLFTPAELKFLATLDQSLLVGQRAFGKVRIMDLVEMKPGLKPQVRQAAVNRMAQKHVDFLICSGGTMTPVCAIELNDGSHSSAKAKHRDEFLSSVCSQIGLPLLVVKASTGYSVESVRQQIANAMQASAQDAQRVV